MKNKILSLTLDKNLFQKKSKKISYYGIFDEKLQKEFRNLNYIDELNDKYCPKETIRDLSYCEKIYNRILKELTTRLNKFHNCAFSQKEWQIIFGNWLFQFICIVFRKYKSILVLINKNEFKNIYVNFSDQFTPSPDIFHLHSVTNQREWNERLTSKIIKFLANKKKINLINLNTKSKKINYDNFISDKFLTSSKFSHLQFLDKLNLNKKKNFLIYQTSLGFLNEKKLEIKLSQFPNDWHFPLINLSETVNEKIRNNLFKLKIINNNFNSLILNLLPRYFSSRYIENFSKIMKNIDKLNLPKKPKFILTSNIHANILFNFYIMRKKKENKTKLILLQHGNNSSIDLKYKYSLEHKVADHFLTWGHKNSKKDIKLFNTHSIRIKKKKYNSNLSKFGIFLHPLRQHPLFCDLSERTQNIIRFKKLINKINEKLNYNIKKNTYVKLFPADYSKDKLNLQKSLKKCKLKIYSNPNPYDLINESRLNFFLYLSTGVFETLSMNRPTVVYSPQILGTIDRKYKKFFRLLYNSKILFNSIDDLLLHVDNVWPNINKWWLDKKVQSSIKKFNDNLNVSGSNNLNFIERKLNAFT